MSLDVSQYCVSWDLNVSREFDISQETQRPSRTTRRDIETKAAEKLLNAKIHIFCNDTDRHSGGIGEDGRQIDRLIWRK